MPLVRRTVWQPSLAVVFSGIFHISSGEIIASLALLISARCPRRELLFGNIAVCKATFHQLSGIVRIINGKVTAVSPFDASPRICTQAERWNVEACTEDASSSPRVLARRARISPADLIGKGDRQNVPRADQGNCQYLRRRSTSSGSFPSM